jgi:hypothetical protein
MLRATCPLALRADAGLKGGVRLAAALALQRLGGIGFDAQTRTKTTSQLLQGLSAAEVSQYMERLEKMFLEGGGWPGWAGLGWAGLGGVGPCTVDARLGWCAAGACQACCLVVAARRPARLPHPSGPLARCHSILTATAYPALPGGV